jgi:RNA polymerase sigma-70 factor (ECF subfamily)
MNALDSWLFRVMSNCFIDICRKQKQHVDIDDIVLFEEETPESIHSRSEMLASVRTAIARLPLKHRQVLTLIDLENFAYAEVSEILMVPIGTIMSRLNRARQALKQMLEEEYHNTDSKTPLRLVK